MEVRAKRQGGGREERMKLRSARASRGREGLWRKASCTEHKRSQERAIGGREVFKGFVLSPPLCALVGAPVFVLFFVSCPLSAGFFLRFLEL